MLSHSTEPFTEEEKDGIFRFLGYANWKSLAQSIQLGYPSASQPFFLVSDSLHRVAPETRARVRKDLARALDVECQIEQSNSRIKVTKVAEVTMNGGEMDDLLKRLRYWTVRIADALGVEPNPFSLSANHGLGGGLNAKVVS